MQELARADLLFHSATDAEQTRDLAVQEPGRVAALEPQLRAHMQHLDIPEEKRLRL